MVTDLRCGDALTLLREMPDESVHCVVTSPPYWGLRDYGTAKWIGGDARCDHRSPTMREGRNEDRQALKGSVATNSGQLLNMARKGVCGKCGAKRVDQQMGMEPTLGEHIANMVTLFREVRRVLRSDGTFWLNYGDCYATSPNGRSAAATKEAGNDDRTFRDKPFSTIGPIYRNKREGERWGGGNNSDPTLKVKDLVMMPNRIAIALQDDGWWVRSEIIWHKPNPMPESIRDRPGTAHEKIWLLSKSARYYYDAEAVKQPVAAATVERLLQNVAAQVGSVRANGGRKTNGTMKAVGTLKQDGHGRRFDEFNGRYYDPDTENANLSGLRNLRNVWTVSPKGYKGAHFATFPPELIKPCILAGCPVGGTVLDPFVGAGTTGLVAEELGRNCIGLELNPDYIALARGRLEAARAERHAAMMEATAQGDLFASLAQAAE